MPPQMGIYVLKSWHWMWWKHHRDTRPTQWATQTSFSRSIFPHASSPRQAIVAQCLLCFLIWWKQVKNSPFWNLLMCSLCSEIQRDILLVEWLDVITAAMFIFWIFREEHLPYTQVLATDLFKIYYTSIMNVSQSALQQDMSYDAVKMDCKCIRKQTPWIIEVFDFWTFGKLMKVWCILVMVVGGHIHGSSIQVFTK